MTYVKNGGAEMSEMEETVSNVRHNSGTPDEHLCYIISQGFHISDEQNYHALIVDPKFRCGHCKKQAASERNLCVSMEL